MKITILQYIDWIPFKIMYKLSTLQHFTRTHALFTSIHYCYLSRSANKPHNVQRPAKEEAAAHAMTAPQKNTLEFLLWLPLLYLVFHFPMKLKKYVNSAQLSTSTPEFALNLHFMWFVDRFSDFDLL